MPRRASITHPALRAIAQDQRYAPSGAAVRAVERIEALASEVEAGRVYPRDYVVFRVTGYRADDAAFELVPGAALLEDLSALAETICSQARLGDDAAPAGALTLEALCERWGVSRRTVERDRRRGLVARRLRDEAGHERLLFAPSVVEAFELEHAERGPLHDTNRAPAKRLTPDELRTIRRWAEGYERSLDLSRHAIAGRIASRLGRSISAVRRALDEADVSERTSIDERASRVMLRLWERGVTLEELAARSARTRTTAHRVVLRARLQRALAVGPAPEAERPGQESGALDQAVSDEEFRAGAAPDTVPRNDGLIGGAGVLWPDSLAGVAALASRPGPVPERLERALALSARAAHRRAHTLAVSLDDDHAGTAPPAHLVDRIETDLRWSVAATTRLAALEIGLVVRTVEDRAGAPLLEIDERLAARCVEEGMLRVAEGAERFDATRGGRLAGRVSLAVDRAVVGVLERESERRAAFSAARRDRVALGGWRWRVLAPARALLAPGWLLAGLDRADGEARSVVERRFGLADGRPRTALEIASALGTTPHAVWGLYRRAVLASRGPA